MTDYTPEQADEANIALSKAARALSPAEKSLKFTDQKFAALVRESSRIKQERDELLAALDWVVDEINKFGSVEILACNAKFNEFRELIAKVKK